MSTNVAISDNPLLKCSGLPPFTEVKPEHVEPALNKLLSELNEELTQLEADVKPTWSGLVEPLERLTERLTWSWGIVSHLMGVKNSPELRQAYETSQPQIVQFSTRIGQSKPIYDAFKALREGDKWNSLDSAQQRIVESSIRDAELAGIGLEGEAQARFNAIQMEMAELSTKFSNHVLDATKAFKLKLVNPEEVEGLPPSWLSLAAQAARDAGDENATPENGPWLVTLDFPSYAPFMQHSKRRDLREQMYKAFVSRASAGELDNRPIIKRILELRQELAELLGYQNYAEVSLASKMAPNVEAVAKLLEELRLTSYDAAQK